MKKLFLVALVCAANICIQTHSFQSNIQQLPREVIQELKLKQHAETPLQPTHKKHATSVKKK